MATIVTRAGKGSALTWTEGDANITNINAELVTKVASVSASGTVSGITLSASGTTTPALTLGGTLDLSSPPAIGGTAANTISGTTITATTQFSGPGTGLTGTASSLSIGGNATTATTATGATNINISTTDGNASDTTMFPVLVGAGATGNQLPHIDGAGLSYNASTNTLTATTFSGALSGNATSASGVTVNATAGSSINSAIPYAQSNVLYSNGSNFYWDVTNTKLVAYSSSFGPGSVTISGSLTVSATTSFNATNAVKLATGTGAVSASAWTNTGIAVRVSAATFTDTSSVAGTIAASHINAFAVPTMASTNAITVTDAANVFIAGAPTASTNTTITNAWALLVNGAMKANSIQNTPIGSTTASTGKFTSLQFNSTIETGGTASTATGAYTYAPNAANGSVQTLNMSTATSLTFSAFTSPVAGQSLTVIVTNGTGGVTTFTSTMKWAGGVKSLTSGNGSIDIITVYYDGTTYYASIGKGYA